MSSPVIATVVKMMESLPVELQDRVAEYIRDYISDLQEEACWEASFQRTQANLVAAARRAKQEIARGLASPMDYDRL